MHVTVPRPPCDNGANNTQNCAQPRAAEPTTNLPVTIRVDAAEPRGELKPIYSFFGADEPNYADLKDGKIILRDIGRLGEPQEYFRTHRLLVTGDGIPAPEWGSTNASTEDAQGRPIYDWTIVDRIFDTYLANGVKPSAQIGFMPQALSTKPEPYQHEWRPGFRYNDIYSGGIGRSGTRPTSATGKARPRNFGNSTTTRSTPRAANSPCSSGTITTTM